jgi:hypothetical protein
VSNSVWQALTELDLKPLSQKHHQKSVDKISSPLFEHFSDSSARKRDFQNSRFEKLEPKLGYS